MPRGKGLAALCGAIAVIVSLHHVTSQQLPAPGSAAFPPYFLYQQLPAPVPTGFIGVVPHVEAGAQAFSDGYPENFVHGYGDGVVGLNLKTELVASASMSVAGGAAGQGTIAFVQVPYRFPSAQVYVIGAVSLGTSAANANLQNLVVSVHENPDITDNCGNIGPIYNAGGLFLADGGIITRGESSNSGGVVNFNVETSKLLGGIRNLANQRTVAITNGGQVLACGLIVYA